MKDETGQLVERAAAFAAAVLAALATGACERSESPVAVGPPAQAAAAPGPAAVPEDRVIPPSAPSSHSIYNLESVWKTKKGTEMPLGGLGGKIQVLAMGYTTCEYACPRLIHDMRQIEERLGDVDAGELGFAFVSIDPEIDTPEQLSEYVEKHELTPEKWRLLTGDEGSVLELAVLLGVKYRKTTETDFAHSNVITVLNAEGEIVHQQIGLGSDPAETIAVVRRLRAGDGGAGDLR